MKTLTIVLTDGPYISEYADMACKLAGAALNHYHVNIFLYLDAVHIPKNGQAPSFFSSLGELFTDLAEKGAVIRACARCAAARGYQAKAGDSEDYPPGIKVTSLYELAGMLSESDRIIALSR